MVGDGIPNPCCPLHLDSVAALFGSEVSWGKLAAAFIALLSQKCDWQIFAASPLCLYPILGLVRSGPVARGKTVSVVPVLGIADDVLSNPTLPAIASPGPAASWKG